jgi:hypothetical protein
MTDPPYGSVSVKEGCTMRVSLPNQYRGKPLIWRQGTGVSRNGGDYSDLIASVTLFCGAAWGVGYAVGTGIHNLIEDYDPDLDDVIGCTVQAVFDNIDEAGTEFQQGNLGMV